MPTVTDVETDEGPRLCRHCGGASWVMGEIDGKPARVGCKACEWTGVEGGLPHELRTQRTPEEEAYLERWDRAVASASEWYQANA